MDGIGADQLEDTMGRFSVTEGFKRVPSVPLALNHGSMITVITVGTVTVGTKVDAQVEAENNIVGTNGGIELKGFGVLD